MSVPRPAVSMVAASFVLLVHARALLAQETPPAGQDPAPAALGPPPGLAALEAERSRACVDVIARLEAVDSDLAPLAARSQRLIVIAQQVAIEERSFADSLDASDPLEAEVRDWFAADLELAERYLAEGDESIAEERATAREAIKARIAGALEAVQAEANERIASEGDLMARAPQCDGALLLRGAVLEACETTDSPTDSPLCEAARGDRSDPRFRFVERAEDLWDHHELRAWTAPEPLRAGPDGQLTGARTMGTTRAGNLLVTVVFAPLVQDRSELAPELAERLAAVGDSLGIDSTHPDLAVGPSLALRANLPGALADESGYVLHFGAPETAEVLWSGPVAEGGPLQAEVPLAAAHVARLVSGQPMHFTAVRSSPEGTAEALYTVQLSTVNQVAATRSLLGYMTGQLSADLARLVEPGSR